MPSRTDALIVLAALLLLGLYLFASFGLAGDLDLTRKMNGFFDMDIHRVVEDWTTGGGGQRTGVHPLYKLAVAPLGTVIRQGDPDPKAGLDIVRWIVALAMTLNALLIGRLASQLAGGSRSAMLAATLLSGLSFSSILLGAVPESASIACLSAVMPLLFLGARLGKTMPWWEVLSWICLGVLGIGLTITQVMFWAIALLVRVGSQEMEAAMIRSRFQMIARAVGRLMVIMAGFALLTVVLSEVQSRLYPVTHPPFYLWRVGAEMHWLQLDALQSDPAGHVLNVIRHLAVYDFVAPQVGMSDYLFRLYGTNSPVAWWSVSIDGAPLGKSGIPEIVALIGLMALFVTVILRFRRRLPLPFLAPSLCIGTQLLLHVFYGREYIIFSANWHGVLAALLVGILWRTGRVTGRVVPVLGGLWLIVLAANNLAALGRAYGEFEGGLAASQRDEQGVLLPLDVDPENRQR